MKLWLTLVAANILTAMVGSAQPTAPAMSWPFGPYDKNIQRRLPSGSSLFLKPPRGSVRGVIVLPRSQTDSETLSPRLHLGPPQPRPLATNQTLTPGLRLTPQD